MTSRCGRRLTSFGFITLTVPEIFAVCVRNQIGDKRISMLKKSDKSDIKRKDYICVR